MTGFQRFGMHFSAGFQLVTTLPTHYNTLLNKEY